MWPGPRAKDCHWPSAWLYGTGTTLRSCRWRERAVRAGAAPQGFPRGLSRESQATLLNENTPDLFPPCPQNRALPPWGSGRAAGVAWPDPRETPPTLQSRFLWGRGTQGLSLPQLHRWGHQQHDAPLATGPGHILWSGLTSPKATPQGLPVPSSSVGSEPGHEGDGHCQRGASARQLPCPPRAGLPIPVPLPTHSALSHLAAPPPGLIRSEGLLELPPLTVTKSNGGLGSCLLLRAEGQLDPGLCIPGCPGGWLAMGQEAHRHTAVVRRELTVTVGVSLYRRVHLLNVLWCHPPPTS